MNLSNIGKRFSGCGPMKLLDEKIKQLHEKGGVIKLQGIHGSSGAFVSCSLLRRLNVSGCAFIMLGDHEDAAYFFQDMQAIASGTADEGRIVFFPSSFRKKGNTFVPDDSAAIMRTEVLGLLASGGGPIAIVTYPEALAEQVPDAESVSDRSFMIETDGTLDLGKTKEKLIEWGFKLVDYVYSPGEFAIRGSIIDIFSYTYANPIRVDLFGDDVESIRTFDVANQFSIAQQDSVIIAPSANGCTDKLVPLFNLLSSDTVMVFAGEMDYFCEKIDSFTNELKKFSKAECVAGSVLKAVSRKYVVVELNPQVRATAVSDNVVTMNTHAQPLFHKNFELVKNSFSEMAEKGYDVFIAADSSKQLQRISDVLEGMGAKNLFVPVTGSVHAGFSCDDIRCCVFTDHEIFDRYHRYRLAAENGTRSGRNALTLKEINNLQVGDFVVHIDHGIGKFMGLVHTGEGDSRQEAIRLAYAGGDIVMVSINALHKLSKYRGKDGGTPPALSHLGTGAWQRMKDRAKKHIKDIARDLIRLYAERRTKKGFAYSPDTYMQHELEASFVYEDTPDQAKAVRSVKEDMESSRPMDRLICGDVGFGKTEIAVRAAFKAAVDGKQTAVLVPTTILALQHYKTFSSRLKDFPVRVEYLSRARNTRETKAILRDLNDGKIDIIIGTHKLTGKNVKFHDLGLLVIDEEQKFGVAVKEKLRKLKTEVDTLTLSATPIPRTLQFSLMGARDLSVLRTPPPNRYPIDTQIVTMSDDVLEEAVGRELARGGQVFCVNNRVSSLPALRSRIERLVPGARVAVGHGQMPPEEMERVLLGFINYDYDVLVSTAIVENGIDIPNAGTIVIENAQNFGLSDLHQMRGRVGRSDKRAYCYLVAPPLSSLPDNSRRRLEAVEGFSDLGSGFNIALQDLDIRGAGNLLGAEQSGFIANLGYETFGKVLSQAVSELKAEEFASLYEDENKESAGEGHGKLYVDDCAVESDLPMYFPETYVPGESERIALYRELDSIEDDESLKRFRKHLADRFGNPPRQATALMQIPTLRRKARCVGVERVVLKGGKMYLYFVRSKNDAFYKSDMFSRVISYAMQNIRECRLDETHGKRRMAVDGIRSVEQGIDVLDKIIAMPCMSEREIG